MDGHYCKSPLMHPLKGEREHTNPKQNGKSKETSKI